MKRALLPILALVAPLAGASLVTFTPKDDLRSAQRCYADGTNYIARGMFREAEGRIDPGTDTVEGRLRELENRARTVEPLQVFADQFQTIRDRFEEDWTNAVVEALALEAPIRAFLETNAVVKEPPDWRMNAFGRLQTALHDGNRMAADTNLRIAEDMIRGQIGAFRELQGLEAGFKNVLADLERAREELRAERAKPLDAERALRIAREYIDAALAKIKAPGSRFVGADWDFTCAERYLEDVRRTGELKEGAAEVEAALAKGKRLRNLVGFRWYLQRARDNLQKARGQTETDHQDLEAALSGVRTAV